MTDNLAPSPLPRPTSPRAHLSDLAPLAPTLRGEGEGHVLKQDDLAPPDEWQERLRDAVAETLRRRAAKAALRAERATARAYGLRARHAAKLARNRRPPSTDSSTGPTTKES